MWRCCKGFSWWLLCSSNNLWSHSTNDHLVRPPFLSPVSGPLVISPPRARVCWTHSFSGRLNCPPAHLCWLGKKRCLVLFLDLPHSKLKMKLFVSPMIQIMDLELLLFQLMRKLAKELETLSAQVPYSPPWHLLTVLVAWISPSRLVGPSAFAPGTSIRLGCTDEWIGIVWINCSQPTIIQAPWGGYKFSGVGRELGPWGLENYLETKQICSWTNKNTVGWGWYVLPKPSCFDDWLVCSFM